MTVRPLTEDDVDEVLASRSDGELWDAVVMGLVLDAEAPCPPHGS